MSLTLQDKIKGLPEKSGVYLMRNAAGEIIYIGKAVSLKNRVKQYFNRSPKQEKVQAMVDNIADFDYIITLSEKDALALEANLVKKHKPRYNILLKDDKQSPYIKIDLRPPYPCIEVTRLYKKDGARYFGPYFNGIYVRDIVEIIRSAYRMRTCAKILPKRARPCLNHQIGLCDAPCVQNVTPDEYKKTVERVLHFLAGNEDSAEVLLDERMRAAAEAEEFERAMRYRDRLKMIARLKERTIANLGQAENLDAFSYATNGLTSAVAVSLVRGRKMLGVRNFAVTDASLNAGDALAAFIMQYYAVGRNNEIPREICLDRRFDFAALSEALTAAAGYRVSLTVPERGSRRLIVKTTEENAREYLVKSVTKRQQEEEMTVLAADKLARILGIKSARRMECYDISNISGVDKVASGVVFINGAPDKSQYRRYRIKTVEGADDFASMAEVVKRRLKRAEAGSENFLELPDLFVIDGGKGQLSAAHGAMTAEGFDIAMVGLAKREEEIFTVGSPDPVVLSRDDYALRLLQRIRDEAHRFAVTYHRNLRSKRYLSELEDIRGVGKRRLQALYRAFKSIDGIRTAEVGALCRVPGIDRVAAQNIYSHFHPDET
ncbi:MAG: excinuclease ABC subunit UvrC [Clostridiales bacterium]|jgi:excinuclease ABC subunit C|nr:excinuclease ABC subunit UvrC [Clostridiales bacterium]